MGSQISLPATSLVSSSWTAAVKVRITGKRGGKVVGTECAWTALHSLERYYSLY